MNVADEYFGSPDKITLLRRGAALWSLVKDCPRYAYFGRLVSVSAPTEDTVEILAALAHLQGVAVAYRVPKESASALFHRLEGRGFTTDRHEFYRGDETAYARCKALLNQYSLPEDLVVSALDEHTDSEIVAAVVDLCQSCGVFPVQGAVMRGRSRRGINLIACDASGHPVGTASSIVAHHPESQYANEVFWGMLATREDRRGEKIALILGAMGIVHMWEREGARGFFTGIRQDNEPSRALCVKLGLTDSPWIFAECIDTKLLGSPTFTR